MTSMRNNLYEAKMIKNCYWFHLILWGFSLIQPGLADSNPLNNQPTPPPSIVPTKTSSEVIVVASPNDDKLIKQFFNKVSYKNFQHSPVLKLFKIKEFQ